MADSILSPYPLEGPTNAQLKQLCNALWGWELCSDCTSSRSCGIKVCPSQRLTRLEPFFQFYRGITYLYMPELLIGSQQALGSHEDLSEIIRFLKEHPERPRAHLTTEYFSSRGTDGQPPMADQHRAFSLALRVMTSINTTVENQPGGLLESGSTPAVWRSDKSLAEFLQSMFPTRDHPSLNEQDGDYANIKADLTAQRLKKIAGLKFEAADDIRNHLRLDQRTGVVEIYHHSSVLKEHLMATMDPTQREVLPRQLVLETLSTLQGILFPLDRGSQALLRTLVSKQQFDPDCLRFGSAPYRRDDEGEVTYRYWGSRLMDLYDEIENPKPRGLLDVWLEQRSKARHVMMATVAGVIAAIILGILGLAVGIFQACITYQQWKKPATDTANAR